MDIEDIIQAIAEALQNPSILKRAQRDLSPSCLEKFRWPAPSFNPVLPPALRVLSICELLLTWIAPIRRCQHFIAQLTTVSDTIDTLSAHDLGRSRRQVNRILKAKCRPKLGTLCILARQIPGTPPLSLQPNTSTCMRINSYPRGPKLGTEPPFELSIFQRT